MCLINDRTCKVGWGSLNIIPSPYIIHRLFLEISGYISEYNNNHIIGTTFVVLQEILQAENVIINIL